MPLDGATWTILGADTLNSDVNLDNIPVIGPIIDTINTTIIPGINGALTTAVDATNTAIGLANTAINGISTGITDTVNPFIKGIDAVASTFGLPTISQVTVDIPDVPKDSHVRYSIDQPYRPSGEQHIRPSRRD